MTTPTYTVPSGTKVPFVTPGMTSDLQNAYAALTAIGGIDAGNTAYGIDTSGAADSSAALASALSGLGSGGGKIRLRGTVLLKAGHIGPLSSGLHLTGDEWDQTTVIYQGTGANPYCFDLDPVGRTGSSPLEDIHIEGINFVCSGGPLFGGANMIRSVWERCKFQLTDNNFGLIDNNSGGNATQPGGQGFGTAYFSESWFLSNVYFDNRPAPVVPFWLLDHSQPNSFACNDCKWDFAGGKLWGAVAGNVTQPWLRVLGSQAGSYGSRNGKILNLLAEYPTGGLVDLRNVTGWTIADATMEDFASKAMGTNAMINLGSISGDTQGCEGCSVIRYRRRSGNNMYNGTTGPFDVQLDSHCLNITIDSPDQASGGQVLSVQTNGAKWVRQEGQWPSAGYAYLGAPAAVTIANGGTITPTGLVTAVTTGGSAVTGAVLAAGAGDQQETVLVNKAGQSITFAAAGTSNVADGTGDVLAANHAARFTWSASSGRWFRQ